jgi:hypothetical protein
MVFVGVFFNEILRIWYADMSSCLWYLSLWTCMRFDTKFYIENWVSEYSILQQGIIQGLILNGWGILLIQWDMEKLGFFQE